MKRMLARQIIAPIALIALLSPLFPITAQEEKPAVKTSDVTAETKQKAVALLKEVGSEVQRFGSTENRVRGGIIAADLLWEHDEAAARTMFQSVFNDLQAIVKNVDVPKDEESEEDNKYYSARYDLSRLRSEFLLTLAPRDPRFALSALQSLKVTNLSDEYDPLKGDELELQIASAIAKVDPQQGYDIAKKSLQTGVTNEALITLKDLYKKSPEIAAKFARDMLAKAKTSRLKLPDGVEPSEEEVAKASKVKPPMVGGGNVKAAARASYKPTFVDLSTLTEFLKTANSLNRQTLKSKAEKKIATLTDPEMRELSDVTAKIYGQQKEFEAYSIAGVYGIIVKYSPTAAQLMRRKLNAEQQKYLDENAGSVEGEYYEDFETKTADELAAEAEKGVDQQTRDSRYADAIRKALESDEIEKADKYAAKIKDRKAYEYVFDQIEEARPQIKARRGDLAEVRNMIGAIKTGEEKVNVLTQLIIVIAKRGDMESATKLLAEANQYLPTSLDKLKKMDSALKIAHASVLVKPADGFLIVENNINQSNNLIAAGILINDFYEYQTMDGDEVKFDQMQRQSLTHTPNAVALMKALAAADFDRAKSLADRFSRPEIRTFTRLKLIEALLNPEAEANEKTQRDQFMNEEHGH